MRLILVALVALAMAACSGGDSFTTPSGVKVDYLEKGTGESPAKDSILLLRMLVETPDRVLHQSTVNPIPMQYQPEASGGHLQEVISALKIGDSVRFVVSAENLYLKTYQIQVPSFLKPTDTINISLRLGDQLSQEGYEVYQQQMQIAQAKKDTDSIDAYLLKKNINARKTDSGLRYVVTEAGTDDLPTEGDRVKVHYTLKSFAGDTISSSHRQGQPFGFTLGRGQVIAGWDEGLGYLGEGAKATLYLPSTLAYGERNRPTIPANSILIFDVEVIAIEKQ